MDGNFPGGNFLRGNFRRTDEDILAIWNRNKLFVEFETFHQNIVHDISHLPVDDFTRLKTKMRHIFEKYSQN